jgi:hypothetical protein
MRSRPSVYDLQQIKGRRKLLELQVDCGLEAPAAEQAVIGIFSCEFDAALATRRNASGFKEVHNARTREAEK